VTAVYVLAIALAFAVFAAAWAWLVALPETRRTLAGVEEALTAAEIERDDAQELAAERLHTIVANNRTIKSLNETLVSATTTSARRREELGAERLYGAVLKQRAKDTFAMPTIRGHNSDITSPAAAEEPAPVYEATEAFVPRMSGRAHAERIWGVVDGGAS
jgi:hypothetical protein